MADSDPSICLAARSENRPPFQYSIQDQESIKTVSFLPHERSEPRQASPLRLFECLALFHNLSQRFRITPPRPFFLEMLKKPNNVLIHLDGGLRRQDSPR